MSFKKLFVFLFTLSLACSVCCQAPRQQFDPDSLSPAFFSTLKKEWGQKKKYPPQFEKQILVALSFYPELKYTSIRFRTRIRHTPAFTRSTWTGIFESQRKRHFVITLSNKSEPMLTPLLFKNLPFNAQIGVIGHELAHVVEFASMTTSEIFLHGIKNVSRRYLDQFEFNTDARCIAHGLGYQLLSWSMYVREKMNRENWRGPDYAHREKVNERYMNPSTIKARISTLPIYHQP